jgi:hypothetical protein
MVCGGCHPRLGLCKGYKFLWREVSVEPSRLIEVIFSYARVSIVFSVVVL